MKGLAIRDGLKSIARKFGANLLGKSLSIIRGKPRADNLNDFIDLVYSVRDERGAYLMWRSCTMKYDLGDKKLHNEPLDELLDLILDDD